MENGFIQQARLAQPTSGVTDSCSSSASPRNGSGYRAAPAVLADFILISGLFRRRSLSRRLTPRPCNQVVRNPIQTSHRLTFRVANALVAIITILIVLMQVNVVQTGAAVENAIINDKAFEMEDAESFRALTGTP